MPCGIGLLTVCSPSGDDQLFVPLQKSALFGTVCGKYASCTLTHTFFYRSEVFDDTIEAVYRFPLPDTSIITGCTVSWPDEKYTAGICDRDDAADEFFHAFYESRRGLYVFCEHDTVCTLHVTGITPDTPVQVCISFAFCGSSHEGMTTFHMPLTIPHEYGDGYSLLTVPDPGYRVSVFFHQIQDGSKGIHKQEILLDEKDIIPDRILHLKCKTPQDGSDRPPSGKWPVRYPAPTHTTAFVWTGKVRFNPVKATIAVPSASFMSTPVQTSVPVRLNYSVMIAECITELTVKNLVSQENRALCR